VADKHGMLETGRDYYRLSIQDVLAARDHYHVFLTRKARVIGTAVGRYRFYKSGVSTKEPKTLENSEVRRDSFPCLLVFVDEWIRPTEEERKKRGLSLDAFLPRELHLEDREVRVCVIHAEWQEKSPEQGVEPAFPGSVVSGGYPIFTKVQGEERWATLGCLVSDGRFTYALTNSHVAGRPGESLYTIRHNNEEELGVSSSRQLQKTPFSEVYEGLPGKHALVNLDIGLVELDDLSGVSSQVFGLGPVKGLVDINHDTLSLDLIGCNVLGCGCASGPMRGEIAGLFYRYASAGGYDYIADYLVGPRSAKEGGGVLPFAPTYGDSGTLLVVDEPGSDHDLKALGLLWGGQEDKAGFRRQAYCLATNLGTICHLLDVQLVCDWNTGPRPYFGAYAHVLLPSLCTTAVKDKKLKALMEANAGYISMPLGDTPVSATKGLSKKGFVPLSDVPDLVWKSRSGPFRRGKEGPNHFADMDQPNPEENNQTLLDCCRADAYIDPERWKTFYEQVKAKQKGLLPFRVAQIYGAMVEAVTNRNITGFVCAAGILTHYVFDAAMPLHISYLYNGDDSPGAKKRKKKVDGKMKLVPVAYGVHDVFDNRIVENHADDIRRKLPSGVLRTAKTSKPMLLTDLKSTKDAAKAVVKLMRNTVRHAPPADIVADYADLLDQGTAACDAQLWATYGAGVTAAMAEAVVLVARLWEAAWKQGNGRAITSQHLGEVSQAGLKALYQTKTGFLDSLNLDEIGPALGW
jgi:hypothetical protein